MSTRTSRNRVQYDTTPERMGDIDRLVEATGLKTRKNLIDDALTFYEWMLDEIQKGNLPGYRDAESKEFVQILTKGLGHARPATRASEPRSATRTSEARAATSAEGRSRWRAGR